MDMKPSKEKTPSVTSEALEKRLSATDQAFQGEHKKLEERLKRIEDYLFPPTGPSEPALYLRMEKLDKRLEALQQEMAKSDKDSKKRTKELIEIVGELKKTIKQMSRYEGGKPGGIKARAAG